jgi:hypothetical protein
MYGGGSMDSIGMIVQMTIIMSFIGSVFSYVFLKPINTSIKELNRTLREMQSSQHEMDSRLVRTEESTKSAHHRIDGIEDVLHHGKWG